MATTPRLEHGSGGFPPTHSTTTTTTSAVVITKPYFDPLYLKTIPGILKFAQSVLNFICFICIVAGPNASYPGAGWAEFVSIVAFIVTTVLLVMYLLHLIEILHVVPWLLCEMCYCALWSFFYLIAASVLAAGCSRYSFAASAGAWGAAAELCYCLIWVLLYLIAVIILIHGARTYKYNDGIGAAIFFGFVLMILYGADCFLKFKAWRNGEMAQGGEDSHATTTTNTTTVQQTEYHR